MSKLTRKFIVSLAAILILVALLFLYLNINFIERYFLYQEKKEINRVCEILLEETMAQSDETEIKALIQRVEDAEEVVIAWVKSSSDNDEINMRLRQAFLDKGISLKKYWLWEQDQLDALQDGRSIRVYDQEKLHYSILVEYLSVGESFVAVGKIVPSMDLIFPLINKVTALVFAGAVLVIFVLIYVLVRRITIPLRTIGQTARSIAALDFKTAEVHTGDELEELASDINHMSANLKQAHESLEEKNRQMEELLSNVSHDLKTPVALIKAYAGGMKDGMDDGTFLDTIVAQNQRMEQMIERLLSLARMKKRKNEREYIEISQLLEEMIREMQITADKRALVFSCQVEEYVTVLTDEEAVRSIFSNLLSNAVKYAVGGVIRVTLESRGDGFMFRVENKIEKNTVIDSQRIWEPFFVAEESRNKDISGTGLGLPIVKAAAERCNASCGCSAADGKIEFVIIF